MFKNLGVQIFMVTKFDFGENRCPPPPPPTQTGPTHTLKFQLFSFALILDLEQGTKSSLHRVPMLYLCKFDLNCKLVYEMCSTQRVMPTLLNSAMTLKIRARSPKSLSCPNVISMQIWFLSPTSSEVVLHTRKCQANSIRICTKNNMSPSPLVVVGGGGIA